MIILDTNVLSGVISGVKVPAVVRWLNTKPAEEIWITAITVFEVRMGIERLPEGHRRREIEAGFAEALSDYLCDRVLPFDASAAQQAGVMHAMRLRDGRLVDLRDTQIAGIALIHNAVLATRDVQDFADLGISLINPWTA